MPKIAPAKHRAKASIRRRLWAKLGLGPNDGVSFREDGEGDEEDVIVLCLRPSLVSKFDHVTEFEGFSVDVRTTRSYGTLQSETNSR